MNCIETYPPGERQVAVCRKGGNRFPLPYIAKFLIPEAMDTKAMSLIVGAHARAAEVVMQGLAPGGG
jgi:hypothetical protein